MRSTMLGAVRPQFWRRLIWLFIIFIELTVTKSVQADPWQTEPFLKSVKSSAFDFRYVREGLDSIHSVRFGEDTINQYQEFFNRMTLNKSMNDGAERIQSLKNLSTGDLGTLFHESFHAFKANRMEVEDQYRNYRAWFNARAEVVFESLPQSKRAVALEEAYASFIGSMIDARANFEKMILRPNPNDCELRLAFMRKLWEVDWQQEVRGYYYRDGIGEYWAHKLDGLWTLVTEGTKAYGQFLNEDGAIFVKESLPDLDKKWISVNLFENQISKDFDKTFESELRTIGCYQKN